MKIDGRPALLCVPNMKFAEEMASKYYHKLNIPTLCTVHSIFGELVSDVSSKATMSSWSFYPKCFLSLYQSSHYICFLMAMTRIMNNIILNTFLTIYPISNLCFDMLPSKHMSIQLPNFIALLYNIVANK